MGIIILVMVIGVGQSFASVPMLFATPTYYAQFSDTGGINNGDKVRIAGVDVGRVRSMKIDEDKVVIGYSLGGTQIGTQSRASIRTDTLLGRRNIEIEPRGTEPLRANGVLPLGQTTTPYQIYDAFFDLTKASSGWDTQTVKRSLNVLSETIDQTYPHLSAALDGVARSDTMASAMIRSSSCSPTPTRSQASSAAVVSRSTDCSSTRSHCSRRSTSATTRSACCSSG
jgi:phospholipid/cholesterol/gamma-HCH transport system substrate-binding protein